MDIRIERSNGSAQVQLAGRFDVGSVSAFRGAVKPLLGEDEVHDITVDFGGVQFIDSSALGMLLLLREETQRLNKGVVLKHCGATVQRILSVAQFPRLFRIE